MSVAAITPSPSAPASPPAPFALDREGLETDIDQLHADALAKGEPAPRAAVVERLRRALDDGRATIYRRFFETNEGLACARSLAALEDDLIRTIRAYVTRHVHPGTAANAGERLSIVAVGGYGRFTLAPGSDIDLLFLLPTKATPWGEAVVEAVLYVLWDLKQKVGHATRSVDECIRQAKADMTIRTTLIEARFIEGDRALFDELQQRFDKEVVARTAREFVAAKLGERDARLKRAGNSRYVVVPNVKEGKGGLRDLNTLFWIAHYVYRVKDSEDLVKAGLFTRQEFKMFRRCEEFLWRVRCHLHILAGRAEERLNFDAQRVIAERLRYTRHGGLSPVERFMKHYFLVAKDVGDLTAIVCAALEEKEAKPPAAFDRLVGGLLRRFRSVPGNSSFAIEVDRITIAQGDVFERDPVNIIRLFWIADRFVAAIHPDAIRLVTLSLKLIDARLREDPEANRLFLEILTSRNAPETVLRRMNEAGVLGRFVPEFGRIVALMQFNMYHHYTVDEHLLRAVGILAEIDASRSQEQHPLANEIMPRIANRAALYLAVFMHDVAKGRDEDHSRAGAVIVQQLARRLGLSANEVDLAGWLVENHLLMSNVAQMRDLADRKTIDIFAESVGSVERLRCMLILTICDIKAVGPGVWTGWKGALLRTLYYETEAELLGGRSTMALNKRVATAQTELRTRLSDWPEADVESYLARHYPTYWIRVDLESKVRHANLLRRLAAQNASVTSEVATDRFRAVTEITVIAPDHPRFLSIIAGSCAAAGANIADAQIFTTADGLALDTVTVTRAFDQDEDELRRADRIVKGIERALRGELRLSDVLAAKAAAGKARDNTFAVEPRVIIDNNASNRHTMIQVRGIDRPGLLFDLTWEFARLNLNIVSAHVVTYGEKAVDTFYVTDLTAAKVTEAARQATIRRTLTDVLGAESELAPAEATS